MYVINKRNIWFFGDSYVEYDDNWVRYVADRCGAKIQELGVGGSSIPYLVDRIHSCAPRIKKDDCVVITITDVQRQYLGELHLMKQMIYPPDTRYINRNPYELFENQYVRKMGVSTENKHKVNTAEFQSQILDTLNAYSNYLKYLHDDRITAQQNIAVVNNLISNILPNLPTKKVIYFYSINKDEYEASPFWVKGTQPTADSFWHLYLDYFAQEEGISDVGDILNRVDTPNHWMTEPKFQKRFWTTYNPILKLIGADNPDLII